MGRTYAIITTTIYVPEALKAYAANAQEHKIDNLFFVVTSDKKTPAEAKVCCESIATASGYTFHYLDVEKQEKYLQQYPELHSHVPWNCIQRRNVSILYAYEHGADVIITMDDDNLFVPGSNYVGEHSIVGNNAELSHFSTDTKWVNICEMLEEKRNTKFYHRGYPMDRRWNDDNVVIREETKNGKVVVNGGLWLGDPDVDAIVRIGQDIEATKYLRTGKFALEVGQWCPFNSQNTAVAREVIPAYWMCPCVGRYDDIWPSYIVRRIMDHLGHVISYGTPVVKQERHPHNYFVDFDNERSGMDLTPSFVEALRSCQLTGTSYHDCLLELHDGLRAWLGTADLKRDQRGFLEGFISSMWVWHKTIERCNAKLNNK